LKQPETDSDVTLAQAGYDEHFQAKLEALGGGLAVARIAAAYGESYATWSTEGRCRASIIGKRLAEWREASQRPQVGDFVAGSYSAQSKAFLIEHILPRRTCLLRRAASVRNEAQVVAANVDVVGIVSAFGAGAEHVQRRLINERRLERYLTAVRQSGAEPLLIVNKSDLVTDTAAVTAAVRDKFPGVPLVLLSASRGDGLEQLQAWLTSGRTLGLLGMSGVGKSTLVNALLGGSVQRIGAIREEDARGRHTTSHREIFVLPNGALLMDMPGMREFEPWDPQSSVEPPAPRGERTRYADLRRRKR
jgi:ribosome biogenesis GTPase / thiamine phosphate phosphatase